MKDLDKGAMSSAIKEVISLCGIEILADEVKFQAAIRDFLYSSSYITEQQILIFSIRIGVGKELIKALKKSVIEQNRVLIVANNILVDEYGFDGERCESILAAFVSALGWKNATLPLKSFVASEMPKNINSSSTGRSKSIPFVKCELISFGHYKWQVLYVKGKDALLLSDEITDIGIPYNKEIGETSWQGCSLRRWLNSDFLARFSNEEQKKILSKTVRAEDNPWYQTNAGNSTEDKVFLLSISEVIRYFGDSGSLRNRPENSWIDDIDIDGMSSAIDDKFNTARCAVYKNESTWWWLRSPGKSESKAAYVNADGIVFLNGESAFDDGGTSCVGVRPGVRPAIWLRQ